MSKSAIYAFAFLLFTNAPVVASRFYGVPSAAVVAVVGLLSIPLFHQVVIQRKPLVMLPALPLIGLLVAFEVLAILWADEKKMAVRSTITTMGEGLILYFLVTNVVRTRETLRGVVSTLLIAGSMLGAMSSYQQATGNLRQEFGGFAQTSLDEELIKVDGPDNEARSAGPIGEKNYYAQFMMLLVPLGLMRVKSETGWSARGFWIAVTLLIMSGIACTASRGAAIGFAAMVVAMLLLREVKLRHMTLILGCAIAIVMCVPAYQERLNSMISAAGMLPGSGQVQAIEKSLQGRMSEMWAAAMIFSEHPIHGVGPGNFPPQFLKKAGSLGFQVHAEQRMAHCSYLEIAAETGLIGLLLYLGILGVTLRELWIARNVAAGTSDGDIATAFLLVVIVMMTTALFLSFAFERYYWFTLALAGAAAVVARNPNVSPKSNRLSNAADDGEVAA